jgi:hypothetical protein
MQIDSLSAPTPMRFEKSYKSESDVGLILLRYMKFWSHHHAHITNLLHSRYWQIIIF